VAVIADDDRVTVSTPAGLKLSAAPHHAGEGDLPIAVANEVHDDRLLLDWNAWRLPVPNSDEARHDLEHHAALVTGKERAAAMIDLARLSLSNGMAPEALGYVALALGLVPDLDAKDDVHMLRGAALVLLGRTDEAVPELTRAGVEGTRDSVLWR